MTSEATPTPPVPVDDVAAQAITTDPTSVTDSAANAVDAVQAVAPDVVHHSANLADLFNGIGTHVVYLMGFSFILGSLFTILILVLLDYLRRHK